MCGYEAIVKIYCYREGTEQRGKNLFCVYSLLFVKNKKQTNKKKLNTYIYLSTYEYFCVPIYVYYAFAYTCSLGEGPQEIRNRAFAQEGDVSDRAIAAILRHKKT